MVSGAGPLGTMKLSEMDRVATEQMAEIGIHISDRIQAVGTMAGGAELADLAEELAI